MNIQRSFREQGSTSSGTLYLVATPIGNLEDMTFRAIRTLKEVDLIAAEDTRQTLKLLNHFDIQGRLHSYHEHNKQPSGEALLRHLQEGKSVALVSDAGMPAISDPGYELVCSAIEQDITVVPIPGANAALSALIMSGLPTDGFLFAGFLPREKKQLKDRLLELKLQPATILCYEAPHRIEKTLAAMLENWGNRRAALVRELTKRYEEAARGTLEELVQFLETHPPKGEYCVVVEGADPRLNEEEQASNSWWKQLSLADHVGVYISQGKERNEAMKKAGKDRGISKREVYQSLLEN